MTDKFAEFLKIASQLNKMGIVPLLMGSLGLELVTRLDWQARDIDIHVHGDERGWEAPDEERIYDMDKIDPMMERLGYRLVDQHEHEYQKEGLSVEFGVMETLEAFAGVPLEKLTRKEVEDVEFLLPNADQFLAIYHASSQDSYRNDNNNHKDFAKIAYLEKMAK